MTSFSTGTVECREQGALGDAINVHKVSDKHKRRAEHIEDKLEKQGTGAVAHFWRSFTGRM
jgi:hypothetical protein